MEPCFRTFRDENGFIHALRLVYVDDFLLACSDSPFGRHVFESFHNFVRVEKVGVTSVQTVWRTNHSSLS